MVNLGKIGLTILWCLSMLFISPVNGDIYMHNPRGSNDRNCERNVNRNNGNRLFDSQNNNNGGYACPRAVGGPEVMTNKMYYYVDSLLPIEWTAQHGCGSNPKLKCQIVIQYACEDTLDPLGQFRGGAFPVSATSTNPRPDTYFVGAPRDGIPRDANDAATDTIPTDTTSATANTVETRRFGMHENPLYYQDCRQRQRNRGLFTADQNINRNDARGTRQDNNGNRNGLECPEERDYFPYWHPNPWIDVAVLHNLGNSTVQDEQWCEYYRMNSQNAPIPIQGTCIENSAQGTNQTATNIKNQGNWFNNKASCLANNQVWIEGSNIRFGVSQTQQSQLSFITAQNGMPQLDCQRIKASRSNHLGDAAGTNYQTGLSSDVINAIPEGDTNMARYVWKIPNHPNKNCILRMRYNISTSDYQDQDIGTPGINSTFNGRRSPIRQDPIMEIASNTMLAMNVNTDQLGRTFQDRSYVFEIRSAQNPPSTDAPSQLQADQVVASWMTANPSNMLFNLNVRGKRGNIVQTFPSVEYDFVPDTLNLGVNDAIHFQWTGSDYNPRRGCNDAAGGPPDPNNGQGSNENARADRSNLIQVSLNELGRNIPTFINQSIMFSPNVASRLAYLNQQEILSAQNTRCLTLEEVQALNGNQRETHPRNCFKINGAFTPYFDGQVVPMQNQGVFGYYSSRNNNFSNRDQKGAICVSPSGQRQWCIGRIPMTGNGTIQIVQQQTDNQNNNEQEIILTDTFAPQDDDNDARGDGVLFGCGNMNENMSIRESISVGLTVGLIFVGIGIMIIVQYAFGYMKDKLNNRDPRGPCEYYFGHPLYIRTSKTDELPSPSLSSSSNEITPKNARPVIPPPTIGIRA